MNTPRTDAQEESDRAEYEESRECGWPSFGGVVDSNFARQLERENQALQKELDFLISVIKGESKK